MADQPNATPNATPTPPPAPAAAPPAQPPASPATPPAQPATPPAVPATPPPGQPPAAPPTQPSPPAFPPKDPNAPADPNKPTPPAQAGGDKAQTEAAVVPERYDLKLPKDSLLAQSRLEKIAADAREQKLSNEQAQALVQRESEAVAADRAALMDSWKQKTQTEWVEAAKADPEIGGERFKENVELAHRVLKRFGSEGFNKELLAAGYGNHPELIRTFARMGRAMSEDQLVIPEGRETPQQYKSYTDLYDHPTSPK